MQFIFETRNEKVMKFAMSVVPKPMWTLLHDERVWLGNIKQYYAVSQSREEKFETLSNMYGVVTVGQCVVFC